MQASKRNRILKKKIKMIVEVTDSGFSAYSADYPIYTTGESIVQLMNNAIEAANLYYEDKGYEITRENIRFELDFQQFFQHYRILNARFLAEKIGMNPTLLSQYVQGHKKPSRKQTERILNGIHEIGQELADLNLIYSQ